MFKVYLRCVLAEENFDLAVSDKLMNEYTDIGFVNTNNKRILGSMNELALMYAYCFEQEGSIYGYLLPEIIQQMNRVVMGMLDGNSPINALRNLCAKL